MHVFNALATTFQPAVLVGTLCVLLLLFPLNRIGFTVCVFSFVLVLIIIIISEAKSSLINVTST